MPRGESRKLGSFTRSLAIDGSSVSPPGEDGTAAIRELVEAFAMAWYWGDGEAMEASLHPDFVNRLITLGTECRPLGLQGDLGPLVPPGRRTVELHALEVRRRSASAVVELHGWVIHLHLARANGRWKIVNAMWEFTSLAS